MRYNGYRPLGCSCDYMETTTVGDYSRGERNYVLSRIDPDCPLHGITDIQQLELTKLAIEVRLAELTVHIDNGASVK